MTDRERVIRGLECCIVSIEECECADQCPYESQCWDGTMYLDLMKDALDLLKAQEPRVLTLEEVHESTRLSWQAEHGAMWIETIVGAIAPGLADMEYQGRFRVHSIFFHPEDGSNVTWWGIPYYGKTWRCWTAQPTLEQRKAVKWE